MLPMSHDVSTESADSQYLHNQANGGKNAHHHNGEAQNNAGEFAHCVFAHNVFVGADDGHEHQQYRQNDAVYKLCGEHDSHQVDVGNKDNHCRNDDDKRKDALEEGRFFPGERNACLPAECFADNESGGKGQNACGPCAYAIFPISASMQ